MTKYIQLSLLIFASLSTVYVEFNERVSHEGLIIPRMAIILFNIDIL